MAVRSIRTFRKSISKNDTYPARGDYIHQQVSNFKVKKVWPLFRIPSPSGTPAGIFDLGLVICAHGHNSQRLAASFAALSWIMKSKPMPNVYFVEAAREGEPYEFEEYFKDKQRVVYIKKTIPEGADSLWLKECLWTIGANEAINTNKKLTKLCFIDSDIEFVDQMWAAEVSDKLDIYDVMSPHSHSYYEGTEEVKDYGLMPSIGWTLCVGYKGTSYPGMAFACTVDFFKDRFNSKINLVGRGGGDTFMWYEIAGLKAIDFDLDRLSYHHTFPQNTGLKPPPKIGHASQIAVHRYHGNLNARLYIQRKILFKRAISIPFSEYTYTDDDMVIWSDTIGGRILSRAMPALWNNKIFQTSKGVNTLYDTEAILEYGAINDEYPLVVTCVLPDDSNEPISKVLALKEQFEKMCKAPHTFVCVTNKAIPGVATVPLFDNSIPGHYALGHVFKAINASENTSVLYCDLNVVLYGELNPHRCPLNNVSMMRARESTTPIAWGSWCSHAVYYRGDLSKLTDDFLEMEDHDYQYVDSANLLVELCVKNNIYPTSIEQHFCTRFYNEPIRGETQLILFYDKDPASVDADWIPDYSSYE